MGYLQDNLPQRKVQNVDCSALYPLLLKVKHRALPQERWAGDSDLKTSLIVKDIVPDVEDWQYSGRKRGFDNFRFHIPSQRTAAAERLKFFGFETTIVN